MMPEILSSAPDGEALNEMLESSRAAETSLAAHTARRLGVTFEELAALVDEQGGES